MSCLKILLASYGKLTWFKPSDVQWRLKNHSTSLSADSGSSSSLRANLPALHLQAHTLWRHKGLWYSSQTGGNSRQPDAGSRLWDFYPVPNMRMIQQKQQFQQEAANSGLKTQFSADR